MKLISEDETTRTFETDGMTITVVKHPMFYEPITNTGNMTTLASVTINGTTYSISINGTQYAVSEITNSVTTVYERDSFVAAKALYERLTAKA